MEYKEYGSKNNDIIILLHGGGLSWWNYIDEISLLENEFHIVIPILDGHSGSDTNFTSIESNALEIINFINKNYNGKVKLIGGLSLGGQILLEILSKNPNICECAIIESAFVMPMDFTYKMIEPIFNLSYCLISKKWFSKLQFKNVLNSDTNGFSVDITLSTSVDFVSKTTSFGLVTTGLYFFSSGLNNPMVSI